MGEPDTARRISLSTAEPGAARRIPLPTAARVIVEGAVGVSVIGAGNYARATLLPALAKVRGVRRVSVVTAKGLSAREAGTRFGFESCSTDIEDALGLDTELVIVATRHSQHAALVQQALGRGKALFVEKPLCVSEVELDAIVAAYEEAARRPFLMVGYNRRFAPLVVKLKDRLAQVGRPLILNYRVNAGALAHGSWLLDPGEGEGRIVGEACHFLDLMMHLAGAPVERVHAIAPVGADRAHQAETVVVVVELANGSVGNLIYSADGDSTHPKERLEIIGGGAVAVLEDFRSLVVTHRGRSRRTRTWRRDKGHVAELEATLAAVRDSSGKAPIPFTEIVNGMRATFAVRGSLRTQTPMTVRHA